MGRLLPGASEPILTWFGICCLWKLDTDVEHTVGNRSVRDGRSVGQAAAGRQNRIQIPSMLYSETWVVSTLGSTTRPVLATRIGVSSVLRLAVHHSSGDRLPHRRICVQSER